MSELREYVKLRYMGDCKCGDCQLVPTKVLYQESEKFDALVKVLKLIEYASRKDSLTENERLQSVRSVVLGALEGLNGAVGGSGK